MTAQRKELPLMTVEEFLAWDGGGHVGKLELVAGRVRAMSPASGTHAIIQANLAIAIGGYLRANRPRCRLGTEAPIIPRFDSHRNVRVPDVAVTGRDDVAGKTFPDPVLIIEVLSASNEDDTWERILAAATIPALLEIVTVSSTRTEVKVYRRDAQGAWPQTPNLVLTGGSLELSSIGATIPLSDIYRGTRLLDGSEVEDLP